MMGIETMISGGGPQKVDCFAKFFLQKAIPGSKLRIESLIEL